MELKPGMPVTDPAYGAGVILEVNYCEDFPLLVRFESGLVKFFTSDGRYERLAKPTLSVRSR